MTLRSGVSDAKRAAATLDRTISESKPESELVIASGRLNARKSVPDLGGECGTARTINESSRGRAECYPNPQGSRCLRKILAIASGSA